MRLILARSIFPLEIAFPARTYVPTGAEKRDECNDALRDDAVDAPDLQDVFLNVGKVERETEAYEREEEDECTQSAQAQESDC